MNICNRFRIVHKQKHNDKPMGVHKGKYCGTDVCHYDGLGGTSKVLHTIIYDNDITKVFFDKYNMLYNSVRYNDNSLNMLLADNLSDVKQHCMDCSDDDYVHCILP